MINWWESLTDLQRIFGYIALPTSLFLIIQTILMLFGFIDFNVDTDIDIDMDSDISDIGELKFFSIKGILSFCAFFGWTGIVLAEQGIPKYIIFILSLAAGFVAMFVIALVFFGMSKLQSSGNINLKNTVGKEAKVYLRIPEGRKGTGKVNVIVQERYREYNAVTDEDRPISTGEKVRIIEVLNDGILLVVPEENYKIL